MLIKNIIEVAWKLMIQFWQFLMRVFEKIIQESTQKLSYLQNDRTEDFVSLTVLTSILSFCSEIECLHYFKDVVDSGINEKEINDVIEAVTISSEKKLLFKETDLDKLSSPKLLINTLIAKLQLRAFDGALNSQLTKQLN